MAERITWRSGTDRYSRPQPKRIDAINRTVPDVPIQIDPAEFPDGIAAEPATEIGIVGAINREIEIALGMAIKAGEVEVCGSCSEHGG